jgi:hypothetical protein
MDAPWEKYHMTPEEAQEAAQRSQETLDPRWLEVGDEDDLFITFVAPYRRRRPMIVFTQED